MRVLCVVPVLAAVLLAGCGDDDVEGTYELESVEGDFLPAVVSGMGETDWWISDGRLVVGEDSVLLNETFEDPDGDQGFSFAERDDYSIEGRTLRRIPHAFDPDPADGFEVCDAGGVYRIEEDGDVLRLVELLTDGECDGFDLEYPGLERVYRRD